MLDRDLRKIKGNYGMRDIAIKYNINIDILTEVLKEIQDRLETLEAKKK